MSTKAGRKSTDVTIPVVEDKDEEDEWDDEDDEARYEDIDNEDDDEEDDDDEDDEEEEWDQGEEDWDEQEIELLETLDEDEETSSSRISIAARLGEESTDTTAVGGIVPLLLLENESQYVDLIQSAVAREKQISEHHPERKLQELWQTIPSDRRTVPLYNAYLAALDYSYRQQPQGLSNKSKKRLVQQAESLLYGMIRDDGLTPNIETIHRVLQCYVTSTIGLPSLKIEQFLTLLAMNNHNGHGAVEVPDETLTLALHALSYHASCRRKAKQAASLLSRLQQPPSLAALRSALRSCATIPIDSYPQDKLEAFSIGYHDIYETIVVPEQQRHLHGHALQLAANLLTPDTDKLNQLAKHIFARAMADGTANDFCIRQFRRAASDSIQLQVFGGDYDDLVRIPPVWSRNAISDNDDDEYKAT
jgi:hypothetical protein